MLVLCVAATSPPPPPPPPPSPRGVWRASCLSHLTRPRRPARKGKGRTRAKLCRSRKLERPGKVLGIALICVRGVKVLPPADWMFLLSIVTLPAVLF